MGLIETKTFKSGNSVAIRLPRSLGFEAGMPISIERTGDRLTIRPTEDPDEARKAVARLADALQVSGPITPIGERDGIEFPDRPGLY